jgi:hypothetical protein
MPFAFKLFHRLSRTRWALLSLSLAAVFACDGGEHPITDPGSTTIEARRIRLRPDQVTDLAVTATSDSGVTLTFTEVGDGTGRPASYEMRAATGAFVWGSATIVTHGTCAAPMAGETIGAQRNCSVLGLTPATDYTFELAAFRVTPNQGAVYGALSNQANGTTTYAPAVPVATVTVSPVSAAMLVGGQTAQLSGTTMDSAGNVLTGRTITWASSSTTVATVSTTGLVTAQAAGSATITATSEGPSGSAAITVTTLSPPPPPPPTGCTTGCRYVAVSGNDANAGTSTAPWRTIQHAADVANPGDTVIVRDGVYTGGATIVTIGRSGTAAAWLVFRAANRWGAIIDGQNNSSVTGFEINGNYIRVEGFEVRNTSRYAMETYGGREDIAGNHDIILSQNHLHDVGHICTGTTGGIVGVSAYSDNLTIERNVIHDIGRLGPGEQGCVEPNANWQNHDHGIYNGVGNNVVVRNNVFYNFTRGWAIQRYNGGGSVTSGLTIVNNTFGFPNPWRDAQIIIATPTNNVVIANNLFYQPTTAGVWFDGSNGGTLVGNVSTNAIQTLGTGLTMSGNLQNTDPLFVNATGFNFHLTAGSPARGLGVAAWCPSVDFDGVARSGACSAGAYQN